MLLTFWTLLKMVKISEKIINILNAPKLKIPKKKIPLFFRNNKELSLFPERTEDLNSVKLSVSFRRIYLCR